VTDDDGWKRRSDVGPRLTARDIACLQWIAQQYAIRLDQLQRLLLRYTAQCYRSVSTSNQKSWWIWRKAQGDIHW